MANKSGISEQIISLPKGGGALKGLGEKFSPDLFTGTGNFSVPIALPPGRNGFQPQLNLVYSTGNGNGVLGMGWGLSVPGVSRRTSKGIPLYHDYDSGGESADVFILSGSEDLVPLPAAVPPVQGVTRYRPRTEGLFALIDHHHSLNDDYWEVRTKDGLISVYGTPDRRGDQDPAAIGKDDLRKFAWRLTDTRDPFDNHIRYTYEADSGDDGVHTWKQPLLQRIEYVEQVDAPENFLISVTFNYEDRPDAFSDYRAGFEIRTTKRCNLITVETHFGQTRKVRAYQLKYTNDSLNACALLTRIDVVGYDDDGQQAQELPPLTFGYTVFEPAAVEGRDLIAITGADLPPGNLGRPEYELADLTGDGLPDVLEMNGAVRYWRNIGGGCFDLPRQMPAAPPVALADPDVQMLDANGDGRVELVVTGSPLAGYYTLNHNAEWDRSSLRPYRTVPSFSLEDPEVRLLDLNGDGVTDAIRSSACLECLFNDVERGWSAIVPVRRSSSDVFPDVSFSDLRVKLGDMSGDGLQDIVLVYDGNIEYWPNLGYGKWGKRIHMQNSPVFRDYGYSLGYDPRRVLIGDVNGDGLADIVYVGNDRVCLWINQSGNRWSDPIEICGTPQVTDMDSVRLVDLLGSGIAGILWSADASIGGRPHMFFLDFTGGAKPYLLYEMDNHIGATTRVGYSPSTQFYLEDRKSPRTRWRTSLPFPVQVVSKVEVIDFFSKGKLTTTYRYHHGYWDGAEREFRGFGLVEVLDTEVFTRYHEAGSPASAAFAAVDRRHFSPPTLTRTWFHQGPVENDSGEWYEQDLSGEYWQGDPPLLAHTENVNLRLRSLPDRPSRRDALRTLRGSILRTELYALDNTARADCPYTVTEHAYDVRNVLLADSNGRSRMHVFVPFPVAQRTTQWERGDDPMTSFSFTSDHDEFGQARRQTSVGMPRRSTKRRPITAAVVGSVEANETRILGSQTRTVYAAPDPSLYIHDRVLATLTYELNLPPQVAEQDAQGNNISADIDRVLEAQVGAARSACARFDALQGVRAIVHVLNHYDGAAFSGRSDGRVGPYGALTRTEALVFTDEDLDAAYGNRRPDYLGGTTPPLAGTLAGFGSDLGFRPETAAPYVPGYYANTRSLKRDFQETGLPPGGRTSWPARGAVTGLQDPRGNPTTIAPDTFWMLPARVQNAAGLEVKAAYNYRLLQPESSVDPNGNTTHARYDAAGLLRKRWLTSRDGALGGTELRPDVEYDYDFLAYERTRQDAHPQPAYVHSRQRLRHASDAVGDEKIEAREYSDGMGRLLQKRAQAAALAFGSSGSDVGLPAAATDAPGPASGQSSASRVVVSGSLVCDNKGRAIEKYEPYFDADWNYELDPGHGAHAELSYDPLGRLIRTLNPDGSEQRVVFGVPMNLNTPQEFAPTPWETYTYDANDLALLVVDSMGNPLGQLAPASHHYTPGTTMVNAHGNVIAQIVRRGQAEADRYLTRSRYDARGNLLEIVDALGRSAFRYAYDLLDQELRVEGIDAGVRTSVLDALGNLTEYRDSKGAVVLRRYDELNRLTEIWAVDGANGPQTLSQREMMIYGDKANLADALDRNILGRLYQHFDEAGLLTFESYAFDGNLRDRSRRVVSDQALTAGWTAHWEDGAAAVAELEPAAQAYRTSVQYNVLDRPIQITYPADVNGHRAILVPAYDRSGALRSIRLDGENYVTAIAYNARGQRTLIVYGNSVMTRYRYDEETFRLVRLRSERCNAPAIDTWQGTGAPLQDLTHAYDLAGNLLSIEERVPGCGVRNHPRALEAADPGLRALVGAGNALLRQFEYDALYRLVRSDGRQAARQTALCSEFDSRRGGFAWSGDAATTSPENARDTTEPYEERYTYDPAGNLIRHSRTGDAVRYFGIGGFNPLQWQTQLEAAPGGPAIDWGTQGNRLTHAGAIDAARTHSFDPNGNLTQETSERFFEWDHADRMIGFSHQASAACPNSVRARYLYGADGMRVKKWVRTNGSPLSDESTAYVDGIFEHHRWRETGAPKEDNRLHVMDDQTRVALRRVGNDVFAGDGGPVVQYHLADHLGSCCVVIGGAAANASDFLNREEYFPFGETSFGSFAGKQYRLAARERDRESGLDYGGARYYAPWISRWASCDPAGAHAGLNAYEYLLSNPIKYVDPTGMQPSYPISGPIPQTENVTPAQFEQIAQHALQEQQMVRDGFIDANGVHHEGMPGYEMGELGRTTAGRIIQGPPGEGAFDTYVNDLAEAGEFVEEHTHTGRPGVEPERNLSTTDRGYLNRHNQRLQRIHTLGQVTEINNAGDLPNETYCIRRAAQPGAENPPPEPGPEPITEPSRLPAEPVETMGGGGGRFSGTLRNVGGSLKFGVGVVGVAAPILLGTPHTWGYDTDAAEEEYFIGMVIYGLSFGHLTEPVKPPHMGGNWKDWRNLIDQRRKEREEVERKVCLP